MEKMGLKISGLDDINKKIKTLDNIQLIREMGYALDGTYPKPLYSRVRPSLTPFIRPA